MGSIFIISGSPPSAEPRRGRGIPRSFAARSVIISGFILVMPFLALAADFERDLYAGLVNDAAVKKLQEFLLSEKLYSGPANGNFFNLTKDGVKKFQEREKIKPSLGYFGPKTRTRANELSSKVIPSSVAAFLRIRIAALEDQLKKLKEEAGAATTTAALLAVPQPPPPAPPLSALETGKIKISGVATSTFPDIETSPLKMGEFTVINGTSTAITFSNFEISLSDEMDSTPNRNQKVYFIIRDGLHPTDTKISTTEFTFVLAHPKLGEPHRSSMTFPFAITLGVREEKTFSIWVEQLKFVKSGTLELKATKTVTTKPADIEGLFDFILTKAAPL